jgi:hypothetical protein
MSYNIPLAADILESNVELIEEGETPPAGCDNGSAPPPSSANPEADPGFLCIYEGWFTEPTELTGIFKPEPGFVGGSGKTGAILIVNSGANATDGGGTFAVTAP